MSDIQQNEEKAKDYFDQLNKINNNNYLISLLKNYKVDDIPKTKDFLRIEFFFFLDRYMVGKKRF